MWPVIGCDIQWILNFVKDVLKPIERCLNWPDMCRESYKRSWLDYKSKCDISPWLSYCDIDVQLFDVNCMQG